MVATPAIRDMTPTRSMKGPFGYEQPAYTTTGGLPNFLRFIRSELIPHIDATYRTTRYRLFVGHLLAGLAVVETLLTAPDLFDAYVALDPSLVGWFSTAQGGTTVGAVAKLNKKAGFYCNGFLVAKVRTGSPERGHHFDGQNAISDLNPRRDSGGSIN